MRPLVAFLEWLAARFDAAADTLWGWAYLLRPEDHFEIRDGAEMEFRLNYVTPPAEPDKRLEFRATVVPGSLRVVEEPAPSVPDRRALGTVMDFEVRDRNGLPVDQQGKAMDAREDERNG